MRKKIIITLLLIIPFISIALVVIFRGVISPNNEEIIRDLKNIKCYETKVEYIVKNSKGEEREETTQYYSKDDGVRIEFADEKVKIYKSDGIHVKDNSSTGEYIVDNEMDILHSMAFMNKILSYPLKSESVKEGQEEWGDKIYIQVDTELFLNNEHFNSARIFINKKTKTPIGIIVYDKDGNDSMRIIYEDFKILKEVEKELFN
ncbi:germination lipoprotein GerS-related protein [Clostridium sp. D53t1_180928_C8]|uniref:germination lipoprotein GerS-related protein n=1 Tax=Clostridium sp. D53t1_180928_C8 TaxID=2787101 RepID=UPI0018AC2C98|nr:germination lipoprotein GerS-related protein [Clostridium sp. D53t1_180928_C8]